MKIVIFIVIVLRGIGYLRCSGYVV